MIALANALQGHAEQLYKLDAYETDAAERIRGKGDSVDEIMKHDRFHPGLPPDYC